MLKELKIHNFKCFKDPPPIKFKNFNIICGPNSSGKTSINQAILLLLQNNKNSKENFISNGKFVHFDEFSEIKNNEISRNKKVIISLKNEKNEECKATLMYSKIYEDGIECVENKLEFDLIEETNIYYISANRIGPEDVYSKYNDRLINQFGENAIGFLAKHKDEIINEKYVYEKSLTKQYSFKNEINYWLNLIIGENINTNEISKTDKSIATYGKQGSSFQVRNKNTGSGLSYIISILVMVFSISVKKSECKPVFLIENPEIHLHPTGQMHLIDFLAFMSNFCQFIIETHSDYIIKSILDKKMSNAQIIKLKQDYIPEMYYEKGNYILPMLTLGEIQWTAFDIATIDFHIHLFSYIQHLFETDKINETDRKIRQTDTFKTDSTKYEIKYRISDKNKTETIAVYVRNYIHHPEGERNLKRDFNNVVSFEFLLKESILFMIKIIDELKD